MEWTYSTGGENVGGTGTNVVNMARWDTTQPSMSFIIQVA